MRNIFGWGCSLAALYYAVLRGSDALIVAVRGCTVQGVNLSENKVVMRLVFRIGNPLFVGLTLKGISGDVYVQGIKCGTVNMVYDYYITGRHTHDVPVLVELNTQKMSEAVIANMQSGDIRTLSITFDGGITVGDAMVYLPVQKTVNWNDIVS